MLFGIVVDADAVSNTIEFEVELDPVKELLFNGKDK